MNEKMKKAEYLFSELSGIDERILAEALVVRKKQRWNAKKAIVALVAASLLLAVLPGAFVVADLVREKKADNAIVDIEPTLESVLSDAGGSARVMSYSSPDGIDLFDGSVKIVWSDGESYSVVRLSNESEQNRLTSAVARSFNGARAAEQGEDNEISVWISYGDGRVITPYLKNTAGNVGYGELFEYEPEIAPTRELADVVNSLVTS